MAGKTVSVKQSRPIMSKRGKVYTRRATTRVVYANSEKREPALVWRPQIKTAALYDPDTHWFKGRRAQGQKSPRGVESYRFDDTELGQATKKEMARTQGRTRMIRKS